ncbi:MAG: molybdate ABC transporter permease subunit [Myxococcales bacterium]|nr:molybdate ABC transporter permease subunit [Myxococcales bacterium]
MSALLRWPLLAFLGLPVLALLLTSTPGELAAAWRHPLAGPAVVLSLRTSLVSLALIVATGLPVAWWLARARGPWARAVETLVELPVVIPPAVVGVALLQAYGRQGLLGDGLARLGVQLPFTEAAVVVAQVMVAAPFFVQSATAGLRGVDPDLLLVARTLGASPTRAFWRVALPAARPAVLAGAALAWARALGEFGATLLFAGNLSGRTQTMPLAIFSALEVDLGLARALALLLGGLAFAVLLGLRVLPALRRAP